MASDSHADTSQDKQKCLVIKDDFNFLPYGFMRKIIKDIYESANICVKFESVNGRRALQQFRTGLSDALLLRNDAYMLTEGLIDGRDYIRSKQSIIETHNRIISDKNKRLGPDLADFRSATIGTYRSNHAQMNDLLNIYDVLAFPYETFETRNILRLIDQKRLEGILLDRILLDYLISRDQTIPNRYEISNVFFRQPLYLILNPAYRRYLPKLEVAISRIAPRVRAHLNSLEVSGMKPSKKNQ